MKAVMAVMAVMVKAVALKHFGIKVVTAVTAGTTVTAETAVTAVMVKAVAPKHFGMKAAMDINPKYS